MGIFLNSLPIHTSEFMTERKQVIFTTSKKKRKIMKMLRNPRCWADVPRSDITFINGEYGICHPSMLAKVREILNKTYTYIVSVEL